MTIPRLFAFDPADDAFLLLTYDGVLEGFRHPALSMRVHAEAAAKFIGPYSLAALDPPEHTVFRRVVSAGFTPAQVASYTDSIIRPAIDRAVRRGAAKSRIALGHDISEAFPYEVICAILGLESDEQGAMHRRVTDMVSFNEPAKALAASEGLGEFFMEHFARRRADLNPGLDLISKLLRSALEDGQPLSDIQLVSLLRHLFLGGLETTSGATLNLMLALLSRRERWEAVVADRSLVEPAVEELLRVDPPGAYFNREALEDVEIADTRIPAGAKVYLSVTAANRDPSRWESPHEYDLRRARRPHLAFGAGPHTCVGIHLARRQLYTVLNALADAMPDVELDPSQPTPKIVGWNFHRPSEVHLVRPHGPTDGASS